MTTTSAAEPRTQAQRRDESERRLIEATVELVAKEGVAAATFDRIGRHAGYSRGLASHKFGSKDGLVRALIAHLHARQDEMLALSDVAHMNGLEALMAYVRAHYDALSAEPDLRAYFSLLASAVADLSDIRAAFAQSHERVKGLLTAFVARGKGEGVILKSANAEAVALMVGSALMGAAMQSLIDPDFDAAPVRDETLRTLRAGLAA
jgi:AcrR family transcriptional regulator